MSRMIQGFLLASATLFCACSPLDSGQPEDSLFGATATTDLNYYWQPFSKSSAWNLKLSATRAETAIPAGALASGDMVASDDDYGVKMYFAKASDPVWRISCNGYNSWADTWPSPCPISIRVPAGAQPPTGSDKSVIVVDESLRYAYEMWHFTPQGATAAYAEYIDVVDLRSDGVHRNVGLTASGLPASGGILKAYETKNNIAIRHKLWVAANPAMLYAQAVWPANRWDVGGNGGAAFLKYGDVVALSKTVDINNCGCNLSPFMKRIAKALQDFGGIVQDQGGDSLGFVSEVNAIRDYIDIDYNSKMWEQFGCLEKFMVKVNDPWTGATPGGLGFDVNVDSTGPSTPAGLTASAPSSASVQLDWIDASDNVGVAGYAVLRNGVQVATTAASQYADGNLQPQTRYSYTVRAFDAAGNQSAASAAVAVTTPAASKDAAELVGNPGFESATAPWSLQPWSGKSQVRVCTDRAHAGARSFCITNPSGADGAAVHPYIPVTAGGRYQASAWMYLQGVSWGEAILMVDWFAANNGYLGGAESSGRVQNTTSWVQESAAVTAPAGAAYAMVYLFSYATGTVYYDDVSFKRLP